MNSEVWAARREAERATAQGPLESFGRLFNEILAAIDETAVRLERTSTPYGDVCALLLIKGRNFCVGCYSLMHDGLAQEAGALFRPFLETVALMKYFRLDPNRVGVAFESGKVPEPKRVAKAIASAGDDAVIRRLRGLLSESASHASLSRYSIGHLILLC